LAGRRLGDPLEVSGTPDDNATLAHVVADMAADTTDQSAVPSTTGPASARRPLSPVRWPRKYWSKRPTTTLCVPKTTSIQGALACPCVLLAAPVALPVFAIRSAKT
jgi:hypothetical protein